MSSEFATARVPAFPQVAMPLEGRAATEGTAPARICQFTALHRTALFSRSVHSQQCRKNCRCLSHLNLRYHSPDAMINSAPKEITRSSLPLAIVGRGEISNVVLSMCTSTRQHARARCCHEIQCNSLSVVRISRIFVAVLRS